MEDKHFWWGLNEGEVSKVLSSDLEKGLSKAAVFRFALKILMGDKAQYSGILLGLILILMMV